MRVLASAVVLASAFALLGMGSRTCGRGMCSGGMMGMGGMGMMRGTSSPPPSIGENPLSASKAVLAKGKTLYDAHCAVCHGAEGGGDGPAAAGLNPRPPDLKAASMWSDGQIAAQIVNGRGNMPPFGRSLDRASVWSVVDYVRRLQS